MKLDAQGRLMLMAPGDQYPMPDDLPKDFKPEQIIYRQFDVYGTTVDYRYYDIDKPTGCYSNVDIIAFVKDIIANGYSRNAADEEEDSALDVPVSRESYIIFHLSPEDGYKFSRVNPAITLGTRPPDPPDHYYGQLRYVDDNGNVYPTPTSNCRLVYFAALHRPGDAQNPYEQPFNFNLETASGVLTIIDPDIRYPGNGTS